jgi:hypothetical protein
MKIDGELKTMTVFSSGVNFLDGTVWIIIIASSD